jgi:hypothetical protein
MPTGQGVGTSNGQTLAFQFPIVGFMGDEGNGLRVTYLSNIVSWQSTTAPRIFNNGYSMFFGVSRSSQFHV